MRRTALTISMALAGGCTVDGSGDSPFAPVGGDTTGAPAADGSGSDDGDDPAGDSTGSPVEPEDPAAQYVDEAREKFPTYADLHGGVITRTCSPNGGVCHNEKEYPDLHTPETMLAMLGSPCNLAETDPLSLFNGCEPVGDSLHFMAGANVAFSTEVAYVDFTTDITGATVSAVVYLRDPIPGAMMVPGTFESVAFQRQSTSGMLTVGMIENAASWAPGVAALQINGYATLPAEAKTLLESSLRGGDPNRDGVFGGSDDPYRLLVPGDPWKSYLLQRVQGNVPGSPMPLANQPLSSAEIIALACWIEGAAEQGADSPSASIDYDDCQYAEDFGTAPTGSGATFSGHVQPILDQRCATGGCHGTLAPQAGLDLTAGVARDNLFAPSTQNPDVPLVTPGNPTNSYLMTKLTGTGVAGMQMPLGALPLSADEIEIIRTWISYGAPND